MIVACLKVPAAKLAKRDLTSAAQRVTTVREVLGGRVPELATIYDALLAGFAEGLGIAPRWGEITPDEEEFADRVFRDEIGTDSYVEMLDAPEPDDGLVTASFTGEGGTVRADLRLEGQNRNLVREALITGDFFVTPPRMIFDLEAALRGVEVEDAGAAVERFFAGRPAGFLSLGPGDLRRVIETALSLRATKAAAG